MTPRPACLGASPIAPDDERHGTTAGYVAEQKAGVPHCEPCKKARADYQRWRTYDNALGRPRKLPSLGARRRVRALQRLGWSLAMIANEAGWNSAEALQYVMKSETLTRPTWHRIAETYERLSMTLPPSCSASTRARNHAIRQGYLPPLAWDDIDRDPHPRMGPAIERRHHADIDPVVVERVLAGEKLPTTRAEKDEVLRQWKAKGGSEASLCKRQGWKSSRYDRQVAS